jgi:hypothetical protein
LLLVAVMVLAGCAPRAFSGANAGAAGDASLVIDLPAIVIDIDAGGNPSVGNVPLAQLDSLVGEGMLDSLVVPTQYVDFFTASNIQHIQIDNAPGGLLLLINGRPIPSVRWDGETLAATGSLLTELGAGAPVLEKFLPVLTQLGIGVIVRFPLADGAEPIPTYVAESEAVAASRQAQADFMASVGETPPTIHLPIFYDADGSWRVGDLTDAEWTALTGLPLQAMRLQPGMMNSITGAGINEISLYTTPEGLHVSINGKPLPYIGWAEGEINHLLDLAEQANLWGTLADSGMNMGEIVGIVESLLPIVQSTDTSINVFFPGAVATTQ